MKVIVRGFETDIAEKVKEKAETAINKGLEAFELWSKIADIKADLAIDNGNLLITRKEN